MDVIREYEYFDFEVCISKFIKERGRFGPVFIDELYNKYGGSFGLEWSSSTMPNNAV
jgi:hypothetical protein